MTTAATLTRPSPSIAEPRPSGLPAWTKTPWTPPRCERCDVVLTGQPAESWLTVHYGAVSEDHQSFKVCRDCAYSLVEWIETTPRPSARDATLADVRRALAAIDAKLAHIDG